MMEDRQQAQCMFDRFGAEIYEGEEYFAGNDGTKWILEQLGYQKKTFCLD